MKNFVVIAIQLLFTVSLRATDSAVVSFSVGNRYAFEGTQYCHGNPTPVAVGYTETIVADTTISGYKYFIFVRSQKLPWVYLPGDTGIVSYRRADSTSVFQYYTGPGTEDTIADFSKTVEDSTYIFGRFFPTLSSRYGSVKIISKLFLIYYFAPGLCETYIWLKAAKIDGIFYGDSTLVFVPHNLESSYTISSYLLLHNYPNPFNPSTRIRFSLPSAQSASLEIFDLLGERIEVLFHGRLLPGWHDIEWNAGKYPGGIYFYRLTTSLGSITKSSILLK